MSSKPQLIEIQNVNFPDSEILINIIEANNNFPFKFNRVYTIKSGSKPSLRGEHAHVNQDQLLYLIKGNAKVTLLSVSDNNYEFNLSDKALYIPKNHWIEILLEEESIILCLAEGLYSDIETISNKQQFLNQ